MGFITKNLNLKKKSLLKEKLRRAFIKCKIFVFCILYIPVFDNTVLLYFQVQPKQSHWETRIQAERTQSSLQPGSVPGEYQSNPSWIFSSCLLTYYPWETSKVWWSISSIFLLNSSYVFLNPSGHSLSFIHLLICLI